ncbi:MAG: SAM-dependent methyltransferase [Solirubrobacteraceae bacterium]
MLRYVLLDHALERGLLPDRLLRAGSRWGTAARVRREAKGGVEAQEERLRSLVARMSCGPIAEETGAANAQHYELPAEFFGLFLGPRRKYSGCLWPDGVRDLAGAEEAMLALTCARAGIADGMDVLDLGCGWGSLSLWVAEKYPGARVLGVSNSNGQREWIEAEAGRRGLTNVEIRTQDVNDFDPDRTFDRVVSLEMFEHMRNWAELLRRVSTWLKPDGKLFVHVFSQRRLPYLFQGTWAAERFFTAGVMPSHDMMGFFQRDMVLEQRWVVPGTHYAKTLQAWLGRLDRDAEEALRILGRVHPPRVARRLLATWRLFLISTDEIWGWRHGDEWLVSHYLLSPRG